MRGEPSRKIAAEHGLVRRGRLAVLDRSLDPFVAEAERLQESHYLETVLLVGGLHQRVAPVGPAADAPTGAELARDIPGQGPQIDQRIAAAAHRALRRPPARGDRLDDCVIFGFFVVIAERHWRVAADGRHHGQTARVPSKAPQSPGGGSSTSDHGSRFRSGPPSGAVVRNNYATPCEAREKDSGPRQN